MLGAGPVAQTIEAYQDVLYAYRRKLPTVAFCGLSLKTAKSKTSCAILSKPGTCPVALAGRLFSLSPSGPLVTRPLVRGESLRPASISTSSCPCVVLATCSRPTLTTTRICTCAPRRIRPAIGPTTTAAHLVACKAPTSTIVAVAPI